MHQGCFVLDVLVQIRRDKTAAKRLLPKLVKRQGRAPRVPANACDVDPGQQFDADSQPSGADGALPCSVMLPAPVSPGAKGTLRDSAGPGPLDAPSCPEMVQAASASAPSNTADIALRLTINPFLRFRRGASGLPNDDLAAVVPKTMHFRRPRRVAPGIAGSIFVRIVISNFVFHSGAVRTSIDEVVRLFAASESPSRDGVRDRPSRSSGWIRKYLSLAVGLMLSSLALIRCARAAKQKNPRVMRL
jgi:hypothetical protein